MYTTCCQLEFHILYYFTLNIGTIYTKHVLFCTSPDVNFDFFYVPPPLDFWWGRHRYSLREFHEKYRISMSKKLALITNGLSGYPKTRPESDPKNSAAPRGDRIICNRVRLAEP